MSAVKSSHPVPINYSCLTYTFLPLRIATATVAVIPPTVELTLHFPSSRLSPFAEFSSSPLLRLTCHPLLLIVDAYIRKGFVRNSYVIANSRINILWVCAYFTNQRGILWLDTWVTQTMDNCGRNFRRPNLILVLGSMTLLLSIWRVSTLFGKRTVLSLWENDTDDRWAWSGDWFSFYSLFIKCIWKCILWDNPKSRF